MYYADTERDLQVAYQRPRLRALFLLSEIERFGQALKVTAEHFKHLLCRLDQLRHVRRRRLSRWFGRSLTAASGDLGRGLGIARRSVRPPSR